MDSNLQGALFDHAIVSLVPWIVTVLIGGGLAYASANVLRSWARRSAAIIPAFALIPWRAIAAWVTVVVATHPLIQMRFGIGEKSGIISMGIILLIWMVPCMVQAFLQHGDVAPIWARAVSTARMLAIVSIAITATTVHGTGLLIIFKGWQDANEQLAFQGYAITGFILLVIDLILGVIQFNVSRTKVETAVETTT